MVNAQEWLNEKYPNKGVKNIYINEQLEGELDLSNYDNLWNVFISHYTDKSKLEIKNKGRCTGIIQLVNAQQYLESQEEYNTKEKREQIINLDIRWGILEGSLSLVDFVNLTELNCWDNKITELNLNGLTQLEKIICSNNNLTNFDYSSLNTSKLINLDVSDNNLLEQNLVVFSRFINLEKLSIGNGNKEKVKQNIYNRFAGSLEPLQTCPKLKYLNISNTDIASGLEYLPESLEELVCSAEIRPISQVSKIQEQLAPYKYEIKVLKKENKEWEKRFSVQEKENWIKIGLKVNEWGFASYLKEKGCNPADTTRIGELRKKYSQAQKWLDKEYPRWERHKIRELYLDEKDLEGELDLADFESLEIIYIFYYLNENKLVIKTKEKVKVIKLVYTSNAQEYIDRNYPKEERERLHKLDLTDLDLVGDLDLEKFTGLRKAFLTGNPHLGAIKNVNKSTWTIRLDAQVWLDWKYPIKWQFIKSKWLVKSIELERHKENILGVLTISDFPNLEKVDVKSGNLMHVKIINLTQLQINNCPRLTELDCSWNKLTELTITNCPNLKIMNAYENKLINLDLTNNQQLEELNISSNNFSSDLSFLNNLINLKKLELQNNHFIGSLKPLRNLDKLEKLNISDTDISHGLEYLPESIYGFECSSTKSTRVNDIWEELQGFEKTEIKIEVNGKKEKTNDEGLKKWREVKLDKKFPLLISPLLPPQILSEIEYEKRLAEFTNKSERLKEYLEKSQKNHNNKELDYNEIHFNQWGKHELLLAKELPIKLYNIKNGKEKINTANIEELKKDVKETKKMARGIYANLSYLWGECKDGVNYDGENFTNLTPFGRKALTKAIRACELLEINYLWMDQLCINQDRSEEGKKERGQEVPKMRRYYSNGAITLIAIDDEVSEEINSLNILKKIVNSKWFSRSWTFQEGWLSKQTIFMFDDKLIDGWAMAGTWTLNQLGYANKGRYLSRREFEKGTKKIATPVGWVYYRDGYDENDKVEMRLYQVLKEVKKRGRSVPIDGTYSILGLLPYGDQVKVDYNLTPQQALYDVMKVATENGYGEPIAWHGINNVTPSLCWMPQIYEDGSTSVEGGIDVSHHYQRGGNYPFAEGKNLWLHYPVNYIIQKTSPTIQKLESGFEIEGGLYQREVEVKIRKGTYESKSEWLKKEFVTISLLGTQDTLNLVKENKCLMIPNRREWISNKPFALLVEDVGEKIYGRGDIFHRLGLVELGNGERLKSDEDGEHSIVISFNSQEQLQSQIQIPPK